MVTATHRKDLVRVSFRTEPLNNRSEADIVCYLRVTDVGLTIYYSHHSLRTRGTEKGPMEGETAMRLNLDQALRAKIESCVMYEFWSQFARKTKVYPGAVNDSPQGVVFDD